MGVILEFFPGLRVRFLAVLVFGFRVRGDGAWRLNGVKPPVCNAEGGFSPRSSADRPEGSAEENRPCPLGRGTPRSCIYSSCNYSTYLSSPLINRSRNCSGLVAAKSFLRMSSYDMMREREERMAVWFAEVLAGDTIMKIR